MEWAPRTRKARTRSPTSTCRHGAREQRRAASSRSRRAAPAGGVGRRAAARGDAGCRSRRTRRCATRRPATRSATRATNLVPLSAIARFVERATPTSVNHQDTELATTISFNLAEGTTLDDARAGDRRRPRPTSACRPRCAARSRAPRCSRSSRQPAGAADRRRDRRDLHRARHALREPGAPDHGAVDAAVGRRRRGARAAAVPDGVLDHRADRRVPADRHRQEERDPDHRLRARGRARARPDSRRRRCARRACCASGRS